MILKGTENRNDEVVLYAAARGGEADASDGDAVSASRAAGMASASGRGPEPLPEMFSVQLPSPASQIQVV